MLFSKPSRAVGIDIGSHSVKAVQMSRGSGGRLRVDQAGYAVVDQGQMSADPVMAQASALSEAIRFIPLGQSLIVGALPGQNVVIRYPRLPQLAPAELARAVEKEAGQNIPYELSEVFLDWTPLEPITEGEEKKLKVLLVAAKHEMIDARVQVAQAAEVGLGVLSVDSLALADAADAAGLLNPGETVALVNLGASSTSIHFVKNGISNFIRDVNWGGRELIQAIAKAQRCDFAEAERQLIGFGKGESVIEEAVLPVEAPPPPPSAGSLLDPLDDELGQLGDLGGAPSAPPPPKAAERSMSSGIGEILTSPLNRLVVELRRSLDYYEHQLYEHPVDRLILSGGPAQFTTLPGMLSEELGIDRVEVANPGSGSLQFADERGVQRLHENPAVYMVALGLAARGMADL